MHDIDNGDRRLIRALPQRALGFHAVADTGVNQYSQPQRDSDGWNHNAGKSLHDFFSDVFSERRAR
jgi:hypothetical protein